MRSIFAALILAVSSYSYGQEPVAKVPANDSGALKNTEVTSVKSHPVVTNLPTASTDALPDPYVRPDGKRRMKNYINSIAGPVALVQYVATPALLTARNSPKEWGSKWPGYGRRVGNVVGKNLIRNTTTYALDEAFKVDSSFYRSKDRSIAARFRNAAFSAVTARDKNGKRVVGVPRIAGSFLSEVVSSVAWYPPRYDYVHGLKGGAISLGINAGFNLIREFIYKK